MAGSTLVMDSSDQVTFKLPYIQDNKLLTVSCRSFSRWGREQNTSDFDMEGSQYVVYEWLQPITTYVTQDAHPKIIDALLIVIFRMGQ
jgi:hypothetical protein